MAVKASDNRYDVKGEEPNQYKKLADFDPDSDYLFIPAGLFAIQLLPAKKTDKYAQHEAVRVWFDGKDDPNGDVINQWEGKHWVDFYKDGKVVSEWVDKKKTDSLVVSEHGQYLYSQTVAAMVEGKVYRGRFRMEKHAAKYTAEKPLWQVTECDETLVIPSATYGNRSSGGQTRDAAIQDTLKHACRLLNIEKDTDLLDVLTMLYGDKNKALDAILGLLR